MKPVLPFEPWMESRYRAVCHEIHELHVAKRVIPPDLSSERNALYRAIQKHFRYRPKPQTEEEKFYQERYENVVAQMTEYLSNVPDARYDRLRHECVYLATVLERLRVGLPATVPKAVKEENGWIIVDETHDLDKAQEAFKSEYQNLPPEPKKFYVARNTNFSSSFAYCVKTSGSSVCVCVSRDGGKESRSWAPFSRLVEQGTWYEVDQRTAESRLDNPPAYADTKQWYVGGEGPFSVEELSKAMSKAFSEASGRPKPPAGLMPRKLWIEQRIADIEAAIERYGLSGCAINGEWCTELDDLRNVLQAINLTGG